MRYDINGNPLRPGHNVDRIDIAAGLRELVAAGWDDPYTTEVIAYALRRWARGEEAAAERGAIDRDFHGIDFTSWRRVLAAAVASAEQAAARPAMIDPRKVAADLVAMNEGLLTDMESDDG